MNIFFEQTGPFSACRATEAWCKDHGISVGSAQGDSPRGLLFGDFLIAKWRNLSDREIANPDGIMTGSLRHGPIMIHLNVNEYNCPAVARGVANG